ncbi:MAG: adenine deaminase C-terminal domain-containing protein [Bacillota bacterium]|jgi:adenine deaminase
MSRGRIRPWTNQIMANLIDVSQGKKPADLYLAGANIIDVYRGVVRPANVAISGQRIAYVGSSDKMLGPQTKFIDVSGKILAPGYIEPHGHPFQLYNPVSYAKHVLSHGTTCSINDNLLLLGVMEIDELIKLVENLAELPIKMLWSARLDPQNFTHEEKAKYTRPNISRLINHPLFLQVGELTDWPSLLAGDENMQHWMVETLNLGKKAEGHAPGASRDTLNSLAAAGVTACHEAVTADEVLRRVEVGIYSTLRHSSLRPDLPDILRGLLSQEHVSWERMMMTTDCPTPGYMKRGAADYLIRIALQNNVNPVTAYQLVTRNPAVYYGLDPEIGGIAPGRLADILVLPSLEEPTPEQVYADGQLVVDRSGNQVKHYLPACPINWTEYGLSPLKLTSHRPYSIQMLPADDGQDTFPVMDLVNPVITRKRDILIGTEGLTRQDGRLQVEAGSGLCYGVLLTREFTRITHGIIRGFARNLDALASSYNGSMDLLVLGQNPTAMNLALRRIGELGGGIVIIQKNEIIVELTLPLKGLMSGQEMPDLIRETLRMEEALNQAQYPHYDPVYSLLFLSSTHLPEIRLTRNGLVTVKDRSILRPSTSL